MKFGRFQKLEFGIWNLKFGNLELWNFGNLKFGHFHPASICPPARDRRRKTKKALLSGFESEAKSLGAKADAVAAGTEDIRAGLERGMQGLRAHNCTVLGRHLKTAVKEARCVDVQMRL